MMQRWMGGRCLAVAGFALAGSALFSSFVGAASAWAADEAKPATKAKVALVRPSVSARETVWPSVDGAMSAKFFAPAAYDCTGFVAPSYAGWLTAPPHEAAVSGRFVARVQATSGAQALKLAMAAPQPEAPSGEVASALALSFAPLPPKRLAEQRQIILASLVPLPPRRLTERTLEVPQGMAALEEATPSSDEPVGEDVAAPAEDAARPIDDTPEPVVGRATSDRAPPQIEALIERYAERFDVPARLLRRVAWRESKFDPSQRHGPYWGLMQIRVDTARALGFRGSPRDLLDADTNMTYAAAYLANAYRVAGRDEKRAVMLYAKGYYYEAKRKGMLGSLIRTASAEE